MRVITAEEIDRVLTYPALVQALRRQIDANATMQAGKQNSIAAIAYRHPSAA